MSGIDYLLKDLQDLQHDLTKLEAISEMSMQLAEHQDKDGKIHFDHLATYMKKMALGIKKKKEQLDENLAKELKNA